MIKPISNLKSFISKLFLLKEILNNCCTNKSLFQQKKQVLSMQLTPEIYVYIKIQNVYPLQVHKVHMNCSYT